MEQPMGFYPPASLIRDAERRAVRVLPVDLHHSHVEARCEGERAVRLGLRQVIGLGEDEAAAIVAERDKHGPFGDVRALANRLDLPTQRLQRLIAAGACDALGPRRRLLWELGLAARPLGQGTGSQLAFDLQVGEAPQGLPEPGAWELLVSDYATTGVSVREHPIQQLRPLLDGELLNSAQLAQLPHGAAVAIPGLAVARQRPASAKGIVFLLLEDEHGLFNLVLMPDVYERHRLLARSEPLLLVRGTLEHREGQVTVRVESLAPLDLPSRRALPAEADLQQLRSVAPPPQHFAQGRRRA
jgi:error-prone DNA polymerase